MLTGDGNDLRGGEITSSSLQRGPASPMWGFGWIDPGRTAYRSGRGQALMSGCEGLRAMKRNSFMSEP
ncbi:hypothetical protein [Actinomyces slackii]|uniref:hypothetical protein n=1 Tax=Actinomyces slackii TaxID=52774 RepID=UPI000F832D1B|nr:hypothetical protein [Actinomyces slackii]